ncbi:MAG: glycosyltransferase family 2 protein [Acidobacteria bacterium]|nr:glycosyltransferase family 2 protein [Acidobacteriota bacterium]
MVDTIKQLLQQRDSHTEVIVVDQLAQHDAGSSGILSWEAASSSIRCFNLDRAGLTHARHFGAMQASGRIVLFYEDDVVFWPNSVREHLVIYSDANVSEVAGQALLRGETTRTCGRCCDSSNAIAGIRTSNSI